VGRAIDQVGVALVERLADGPLGVGERIAVDARPGDPLALAGGAVAAAVHVAVEAPDGLRPEPLVPLVGGHAGQSLAEPERDVPLRPGVLAPHRLVHDAVDELVGEQLRHLLVGGAAEEEVQRLPGPRRLEVDAGVARPGPQPGMVLPVRRRLQRLVARVDGEEHRGGEPPPASHPGHRQGQGRPHLPRRLLVLGPVLDAEDQPLDRHRVEAHRAAPGQVGAAGGQDREGGGERSHGPPL
jgi:hypothetical protein